MENNPEFVYLNYVVLAARDGERHWASTAEDIEGFLKDNGEVQGWYASYGYRNLPFYPPKPQAVPAQVGPEDDVPYRPRLRLRLRLAAWDLITEVSKVLMKVIEKSDNFINNRWLATEEQICKEAGTEFWHTRPSERPAGR